MAKSYLTPLNLNGYELLNARAQNLPSAPSSPTVGTFYYDTTVGQFGVYSGTGWLYLTLGSTYSDEAAQDAVGALIAAGTQAGITVTYNDAANSLSFSVPSDGAAGSATLRTLGTGATQAAAGNDSRFSDTRTPTDGTVTNVKVASNAAISADKLADGATNVIMLATERTKLASIASDAAAGTASLRTLGTGALQAAAGNDARLSDARNPIAGSVTNSSVAVGAAISADKLADGTTNVVMTATERSKLAGIAAGATANSTDAFLLSRTNHTGTQTADTITDGTTNKAYTATEKTKLSGIAAGATNYSDTNARANRLDQFAAPAANLSLAGFTITSLGTPVNPTDAANKNYVDAARQGIVVKDPVAVATTANITLSGLQAIDGYTTLANDRVLVKNQTTAANNGIYVAASGAWVRATDADAAGELTAGSLTYVQNGTVNAGTQWVLSTTGTITIGSTAQTWTQFSGASVATAGAGLVQSGNAFAVGAGTGITVAADAISVDTAVVVRKANFSLGDGTATSFVLSHNLNTQDVMVQVYRNSAPYDEVEVDIQRTSVNTVTVIFGAAPAASAYRAVIQG